MNVELLNKLEIDSSMGPKDILEELEGKQFEILERLESASDEGRRAELDELNQQIEREISSVKDEIKILSSALIIDEAEEEKQMSVKEQKRASVESKMNALKEKEAERIAKEGKSKEADVVEADVITETTSEKKPNELELALRDYRNQNYSAAFPVLKKYAEGGDASIQYIVSQMYNEGNGAKQDEERASFWMKSSADNGDVTAQFSYGMQLLSANNDNDKKSSEGLHYLELAADQGYKNGMIQFIESINKGYGTVADANKAINYCNNLIERAEDSFETKKYDAYMKELKKSLKKLKAIELRVLLSTIFTIAGSVFLILGGLYFFGGANADLWETNAFLKALPDAGAKLLLPIDVLWNMLIPYMTLNGMVGIEILVLAKILLTAGNVDVKKKYSEYIKKVATLVVAGLCVWHLVDGIVYGVMKMTVSGEEYALSFLIYMAIFVVVYAIGTCIGSIVGKIFGIQK